MLALSRRKFERIMVSDSIIVTLLEIGEVVKLGVDTPEKPFHLFLRVDEPHPIIDGVTVSIGEIMDRKVVIGIEAPKSVPVYRGELFMQRLLGQQDKPRRSNCAIRRRSKKTN